MPTLFGQQEQGMPKMGRRQFLAGTTGLTAAGLVSAPGERVRSGTHEPVVEHVTMWLPDLDPSHDGVRIAHLTDLHVGWTTRRETLGKAIALANEAKPDLVALTGDYLNHRRRDVPLLGEQLGGLQAPTFAVLGNHDHWVDADGASRQLERLGYSVLRNANSTLRVRGAPLTVVGVDDRMTRHADVPRAFAGASRGTRLALAHVPSTADELAARDETLPCLSGHTHGGQIYIRRLTRFVTRTVMDRYDRGAFDIGRVRLYVSRGVGNSGLKLRVNSRPEVTIVTLRRDAPAHVLRRRDSRAG